MLLVLALLAGAYAVSSALRLTSEETSGRLEPLLATGLSRARWMLGTLTMTVLGSAAVLLAAGLGLGSTYALSTSDPASCSGSPAWSWCTSRPCWCPPASSPWCTAGGPAGPGSPGWCSPCGSCSATSAAC